MKENRTVGPNLKTYFYYTNKLAEDKNVKGVFVIATGIEATGALYDEIGEYLDNKGFAMYAIDEWGYGKTGKVAKTTYKNWGRKDSYYASYNVHALSVLAKREHPDAPIYLIGNDFGAMLSMILIKEFPEVIDKVITIGWGTPRGQDYGFLFTSWLRKIFLYDSGVSNIAHFNKNKRFALRFEKHEKYAWLSSDADQVKKIREAGYIDEAGTVGHYYYYYSSKVKTPLFTRLKKCDRSTPLLLLSGDNDLLTMKGRTTKKLENHLKKRKFTNVETVIVNGRHELLFEKNRFENMDLIIKWAVDGKVENYHAKEENVTQDIYADVEVLKPNNEVVKMNDISKAEVVEEKIEVNSANIEILQEADDELLIKTHKESE